MGQGLCDGDWWAPEWLHCALGVAQGPVVFQELWSPVSPELSVLCGVPEGSGQGRPSTSGVRHQGQHSYLRVVLDGSELRALLWRPGASKVLPTCLQGLRRGSTLAGGRAEVCS